MTKIPGALVKAYLHDAMLSAEEILLGLICCRIAALRFCCRRWKLHGAKHDPVRLAQQQ